jgi:hypothetical protein
MTTAELIAQARAALAESAAYIQAVATAHGIPGRPTSAKLSDAITKTRYAKDGDGTIPAELTAASHMRFETENLAPYLDTAERMLDDGEDPADEQDPRLAAFNPLGPLRTHLAALQARLASAPALKAPEGDLESRLRGWAANRDGRDELFREAAAAGITKAAISALTGVARTTIDRIPGLEP